MRVCRVDEDASSPINTFQCFRHIHPMCSENDDVAFGRLPLRPCDGAWREVADKIRQGFRTSRIRYDDGVTSGDEMPTQCASYLAGSYKSYFHDPSLSCQERIID